MLTFNKLFNIIKVQRLLPLFFLILTCIPSLMFAKPVSIEQVKMAANNWLRLSKNQPLNATISNQILNVEKYKDQKGEILFYIIELKKGYIIISSDDAIEPIISFSANGKFRQSNQNPLFLLLTNDMKGRLKKVKTRNQLNTKLLGQVKQSFVKKANQKWEFLTTKQTSLLTSSIGNINDVCVEPLIKTQWGQLTVAGEACYNYFTPTKYGLWEPGNPKNYPSGCVATAMAQLMRYYSYPTQKVGTKSYDIMVDGYSTTAKLRGGDGKGGAYYWDKMQERPNSGSPVSTRQAIGNLMHDCGLSVKMQYNSTWSGAATTQAAKAFKETFYYANAKRAYDSSVYILPGMYDMLNANLDAKCPVILGITGDGGHAIVSDGYGYNYSTMYNHLILGWDGDDDAWYALPDIETGYSTFDTVYKCIYNVFPEGKGEIISGRVKDLDGNSLANITLIAKTQNETIKTTTDIHGIYAFRAVPSNTEFEIHCAGQATKIVETGASTYSGDGAYTVGNIWGVDFSIDKTNNVYNILFKTNETPEAVLDGNLNQKILFGESTTEVTAIPPQNGNFIKWVSDTNEEFFANPLVIDNILSDMTITAVFSLQVYTIGSVVPIKSDEIISMGKYPFTFKSKAFATTYLGKYYPLKTINIPLPSFQALFLWKKRIPIYDKKLLKTTSYSNYLSTYGPLQPKQIQLNLKTKISKDYRIITYVKDITIVPPIIDDISNPDNDGVYTVTGKYFGTTSPKILLEEKNTGKKFKLKDLREYIYKDSKGKDAVMDYITGKSSLKFSLSPKIPEGNYYFILDNRVGFATNSSNNKLPELSIP